MVREQQVLDLIGRIYDTALDSSLWTSVLHDLVKLTRSNTGNIAELDFANGATRGIAAINIPEQAFSDYATYHWQKDIWTPKPGSFEIGRALNSQQHVPDRVLMRSEIYNDWMKPLRLFYGLGGIPLVEGSKMLLIGVHRPWSRQRPYGDREIRILQQLFPHLKRALQIHHRFNQLTVEREALAQTADQLTRGVFTLNRQGRLLWMNRAAEAVCGQADGLMIRRGQLVTALSDQTRRLHQLIGEALRTSNGNGQAASTGSEQAAGDAMLISRPSGRRSYIVLVSPLRADCHRADERQPSAVVFASDPERDPEVPLDRLMNLYRLTRAEARLVQQLAAGHDLKNIAATTQRTMNTVRTQLKQIFQKTGTSRQAHLVRLVLQAESQEPFARSARRVVPTNCS